MEAKTKLPPKGSQSRIVLEYLCDGYRLTSAEAFSRFGVLRLPNRIHDLRKKYGVKIDQETKYSPTNKKIRWEEYWIEPKEAEKWIQKMYQTI